MRRRSRLLKLVDSFFASSSSSSVSLCSLQVSLRHYVALKQEEGRGEQRRETRTKVRRRGEGERGKVGEGKKKRREREIEIERTSQAHCDSKRR